MAYNSSKMRLMGGVPGQQLFMYQSEDSSTEVSSSAYFNDAVDHYNLSDGDVVLAVTDFGTANVLSALVASVSGETVSMTPLS